MLRTFTAAALALSLIAGPVLAQGPAAGTRAPTNTSQPAKTDAQKTTVIKHVKRHHAGKRHAVKVVRHVKHVKHVRHIKRHYNHVKRIKHPTMPTRG